jgi:hypothetical protein
MVWDGASRKKAAQAAGLTDHGLRQALRRPHVLNHYRSECEVLRTSGRAKRLHRLEEIAASDRNLNASVAAIKVAEQLGEDAVPGRGVPMVPGFVIVVAPSHMPRSADAQPVTINHERSPTVVDVTPEPVELAPRRPALGPHMFKQSKR